MSAHLLGSWFSSFRIAYYLLATTLTFQNLEETLNEGASTVRLGLAARIDIGRHWRPDIGVVRGNYQPLSVLFLEHLS